MRLWRQIQRGLWAVCISSVVLLATMECLYRATFTRLPPTPHVGTEPALLARTPWTAKENMVPLLRRMVPWTLLRVLTALLRARKGQVSLALKGPAPTEWTWLLRTEAVTAQGLRGLSVVAFCWSRSAKLPLPLGGSTSAARCSRFCAARGLAASPSSASFS
jgi:hypothetical protein